MPGIALVTPTHRRDLARCELLCDSVDRYVTGFEQHVLVVDHGDQQEFRHLEGPRRKVLVTETLLPWWLRKVPLVHRHGHGVWFSLRSLPLTGWHIQQLVKLSAASSSEHDVVIVLDSDIAFVKPFDAASVADVTPVHQEPGGIGPWLPDHVRWWRGVHRLLGVDDVVVPGDDYIDSVVPWRTETVRAALERVETVSGCSWVTAFARERAVAEYLLYGVHVATDAEAQSHHRMTTDSFSRSHWDGDRLDAAGVAALVREIAPGEVAIHIQSFGGTPVPVIREGIGLGSP